MTATFAISPKSPDPFSQVEAALWAVLESHAPLAALVPLGNRIRFNGEADDPAKDSATAADAPELMVFPAGFELEGGTSSSIMVRQRYVVSIATDSLNTSRIREYNAIKWELLVAAEKAREGLAAGVKGVYAIRDLKIVSGDERPNDPEKTNVSGKGWFALVIFDARLVFPRAEVLSQ